MPGSIYCVKQERNFKIKQIHHLAGCADAFDLMHTAKNYETAGLQVEKCFTAHIFHLLNKVSAHYTLVALPVKRKENSFLQFFHSIPEILF